MHILLYPTDVDAAEKSFVDSRIFVNNDGTNPKPDTVQFKSLEIWNMGEGVFLKG